MRAACWATPGRPEWTVAIVHVFVPKSRADALARLIAARTAANETLEYKGVPSSPEGIEARQGMETRKVEAENQLRALVADIVDGAKVFQGGGNERLESTLADKVREAAGDSLVRPLRALSARPTIPGGRR